MSQQRSGYQKKTFNKTAKPAARANTQAKSTEGSTETTHYAYTLRSDEEGNLVKDQNGQVEKDFVQGIFIYEQEARIEGVPPLLKLSIGSDVTLTEGSKIYVARRRTN